MESQDVITFKQRPVMVVSDDKRLEYFYDENLMHVLKFLKKGPMTITDLENEFKKIKDEKSDKSIYRYLSKLIKATLVAKAGKRITSVNEDNLSSETVYMRSAKAFIMIRPLDEKGCGKGADCPVWEATRFLLGKLYGGKKLQDKAKEFSEFGIELDRQKDQLAIDLFETADEETLDKISALDWDGINYVLQFVSWFGLISQRDVKADLDKLYK
ncbi:MAG: hypothetical protein FK734_13735 [Asgard group archaeon]|nr:hypothetical protein [Asgard group archaeon]